MKVSSLLGNTLRQTTKDTELVSHDLLLRAGYIRQLSAGIFSYLHLAWRSLRKIEQILREEMDRIGGVEFNMPVVHPADLWRQTGRYDAIDKSLVRFSDRADRDMVLAMTHEEVVASLAASEISSYKQLPKLVYQMQTKFRDELRSRGGLIRTREFVMKDSYSLDTDWAGLEKQYIAHYDAYFRIAARCGLPVVAVQSDVGMMGGKLAHEFMYVTPIGEDTVFLCTACNYKANKEVATVVKESPRHDPQPLEKVHTPNARTIEELADFLQADKASFAKVVLYMCTFQGEEGEYEKLVMVLVRGDMEVNDVKVKNRVGALALRGAQEEEIKAAGAVPGFASPIGLDREQVIVLADEQVANTHNLVSGANELDYHYRNVCYGRDFEADEVGDFTTAYQDGPCPNCGAPLDMVRSVEVGNIFQLGTKYAAALNATYMDESGRPQTMVMGSYGIGVGRTLACIVEAHHDDAGLKLPISVAPYAVMLVSLADNDEVVAQANQLYADLQAAGIEVLYDDRDKKAAGPGVKFKDADLRGIPIRITVSKRATEKGGFELKIRGDKDFEIVQQEDILSEVHTRIQHLKQQLTSQLEAAETWPT